MARINALARASDLKTIPPIEKQQIYGHFTCTYKSVFCYWNTWLQDSFDLTMTFIRGKIRIYANDEGKKIRAEEIIHLNYVFAY